MRGKESKVRREIGKKNRISTRKVNVAKQTTRVQSRTNTFDTIECCSPIHTANTQPYRDYNIILIIHTLSLSLRHFYVRYAARVYIWNVHEAPAIVRYQYVFLVVFYWILCIASSFLFSWCVSYTYRFTSLLHITHYVRDTWTNVVALLHVYIYTAGPAASPPDLKHIVVHSVSWSIDRNACLSLHSPPRAHLVHYWTPERSTISSLTLNDSHT